MDAAFVTAVVAIVLLVSACGAHRAVSVQGSGPLAFSHCMRSNGVPNFPDPDSSGRIPDPATVGINQGSPTFQAANQACGKYRPPYMPSNSAYDAYARTHPNGS
jgi:hypothetical protein